MAINTDPTTWIGFSPTSNDFARYNISLTDYQTLAQQAANRAQTYILNDLQIPQTTLDAVVDGDRFQLAYQKLAAYELIQVRVGFYANTLPFREYESPEQERVEQNDEDLNRWLDIGNRLREEALNILNGYIPENLRTSTNDVLGYNWG